MLRLFALAGLAVMALGSPAAVAQSTALYTVTYVEVGPVLAKVAAVALRTYRDAAQSGTAGLEVLQSSDRPNQFVILGSWADQKAFEASMAGEPMKKLNEKLATMLAAPNDTRQHSALSIAPTQPGKDPVYAVTHVDVMPADKDNAANALEQLADGTRRHAGNLGFDVWRQNGRPNHFTVVEAWNNRGAFDLHQMQKETREFRMKLGPMLGALYDERLYKAIK
jgi:quinol monooxygenase YgiN